MMRVFKAVWKISGECSHGELSIAILVAKDAASAKTLLLSQDFFTWDPHDMSPDLKGAIRAVDTTDAAAMDVVRDYALEDNEWFDQRKRLHASVTVSEVDTSEPQLLSVSQVLERE